MVRLIWGIGAAIAVLAASGAAQARGLEEGMHERIHAPELTGATAWLNVDHPLSLKDLRGQVVVLDFWTYCCINCMHVLPILGELEARHRNDPLVVIGVHSAKFDAEKDPAHILAAMERYGVHHPVAVDSDMRIWSHYAIRSWPTLVIIRPDGTLAAVAPGEPDPKVLEAFVDQQLAEARANGTLAKAPLRPERSSVAPAGPLLFPGKVLAAADGRIFVADSGHHRVLALDAHGKVLLAIGSGLRGHREGRFDEAALDDPQGMALDGDALYIADARAHAIWKADLEVRTVARVAGTFELGRAPLEGAAPARETALRSPWDLALRGRTLYVALAGSHQIGALDLDREAIAPVVGSGREAIVDGVGDEAAFAQPSGLSLSLDGATLYVADSESSGIRAIDLASGRVTTLVGGPGLFDFGDGVGPVVSGMLQHPLAVLATSHGVIVADTYNDKLKRFSADRARLEPFYAGGAGIDLAEPTGLAKLPEGEILIADTNRHRLVRLSADGKRAEVLEVAGAPAAKEGLWAAQAPAGKPEAQAVGWFTAALESPPGMGVAPGKGTLVLDLQAPEGFELNDGAPFTAELEISRRSDLVRLSQGAVHGQTRGGRSQAIEVALTASHAQDVESELLVTLRAVVCDAREHAACYPVSNHFRVPLRLLAAGQPKVAYALPLEVKR